MGVEIKTQRLILRPWRAADLEPFAQPHSDSTDDFDHSKLPERHKLRRHVLYRMNKNEWNQEFFEP